MSPDPRPALSTRQRQVLDYIAATVSERGYPPAVREIGDALGLNSPSTVHAHLSSLVRFGYLRRDPSKPRAIEVVGAPSDTSEGHLPHRGAVRDVPLVGRIAAGSPILADESVEEVLPLPESLVGRGPVFMLRVRGDSMVDAGILDGDLVVIRSQPDADDGALVAALVDGEEATVKRLRRRDGAVVLEAANPAYHPMVFTSGVEVLGVVVSVLRSVR
jgi:repressor LexA